MLDLVSVISRYSLVLDLVTQNEFKLNVVRLKPICSNTLLSSHWTSASQTVAPGGRSGITGGLTKLNN